MVRIIDYRVRTNNSTDETFFSLIAQGIVLVKSRETGMFYATSKEISIPCTFTEEEICKSMLNHQIDGNIQRFECDPYTVTDKQTGEEKVLTHRYEYVPEQRKQLYASDEVMEISELEELAE